MQESVPGYLEYLETFESELKDMKMTDAVSQDAEDKIKIQFYGIEALAESIGFSIQKNYKTMQSQYNVEFLLIIWASAILFSCLSLVFYLIYRQRVLADEKFEKYQRLFHAIVNNTTSMIYLFDTEGRCLLANKACEETFMIPIEQMMGRKRPVLMSNSLSAQHKENDKLIIETRKAHTFEELYEEKDGIHTYFSVKFPVFDASGKLYAVGGISSDISSRINTEKRLIEAVSEKDTLLKELYHRTKNNMQVIQSILNLQADRTKNKEVKTVLEETSLKILSMSLVHQKLYESQNLSQINMQEYIHDLLEIILQSSIATGVPVTVEDPEPLTMVIDTAIPCGLIINELVTN